MYKDRGIIKWAPFDSLIGFREMLLDIMYKNDKKFKPILSEDKLEEMNFILIEAIKQNQEIIIDYYDDGCIKTNFGYVIKIDILGRKIILNDRNKLHLDDILNIQKV